MKLASLARFLGEPKSAGNFLRPLFVYLGLGFVAWWGHHTKWRFIPHALVEEAAAAGTEDAKTNLAEQKSGHPCLLTEQALRKAGIEICEAEEREFQTDVVAPAQVHYIATKTAEISPRAAGTVWRISRNMGESVSAGSVLALVDAIEVGKAKADLLHLIVDRQLKQKLLQRLSSAPDAVPRRQIDETEATCHSLDIQIYNAQQTLVSLGLPVPLEELQVLPASELTQRVKFLGIPTEIAQHLDPDQTTNNLVPLVAPFAGVVVQHSASQGEAVAAGAPLFKVADTSRMLLQLDVRQEDAAKVRLDQGVQFCGVGIEGEISGHVQWISTEVDYRTHTVNVRAEVENPILVNANPPQRLLRANMFGQGAIRVDSHRHAAAIPEDCVQLDGSQPVVFVETATTQFTRRKVSLGEQLRGWIEVTQGVQPGDRVVGVGSNILKTESRVQKLAQGE